MDKGCATRGKTVDEHSACVGVPTDNLIDASAELTAGALGAPGEAKAGTLSNVGGDETTVGEKLGVGEKLPACAANDLGSAATTLVLFANTVEPTPHVPVCRTGGTLGMVGSNAGLTTGVLATKGELTTGTPGNLTGDCGKTGGRGATEIWHACWEGTDAAVLVALAAGTCCCAELEMISTWLPGPKPWEGTTKRVLLSMICVPAARGVEVLMIILCWTVLVAEVDKWVFGGLVVEMFFWSLFIAS